MSQYNDKALIGSLYWANAKLLKGFWDANSSLEGYKVKASNVVANSCFVAGLRLRLHLLSGRR